MYLWSETIYLHVADNSNMFLNKANSEALQMLITGGLNTSIVLKIKKKISKSGIFQKSGSKMLSLLNPQYVLYECIGFLSEGFPIHKCGKLLCCRQDETMPSLER